MLAIALSEMTTSHLAAGDMPADVLAQQGFQQIALRRTADNRFYISGRLNGRRRSFLVDSGWSHTTVNRAGEAGMVTLAEIKLGQVIYTDQPAVQERVRMGGKPAPFDVVLGLDFMRRHGAVIDCGTGRLFTRRTAAIAAEREQLAQAMQRAGFVAVELQLRENVALIVPARIENDAFELLVDSGAAWTCLDRRQAEAWGLKAQPSTTRLSGAGGTGTRGLAVAEVRSLRLGSVALAKVTVGLLDLAAWGLAEPGRSLAEVKGMLGGELLAAHQMVIDCGALQLWLRPRGRK